MGSSATKSQHSAPNFVLDYQHNLIAPVHQTYELLGPNVAAFPAKSQILNELNECISNANPELHAEYAKQFKWLKCYNIACPLLFILLLIPLIALIFLIPPVGIILFLLITVGGIFAFFKMLHTLKGVAKLWRENVLRDLKQKLQQWNAQYPAFTFTIIYPIEQYAYVTSGIICIRVLSALWMYLRITEGTATFGKDEPIFASVQLQTNLITSQMLNSTTEVVVEQRVQNVHVQQYMQPQQYAHVSQHTPQSEIYTQQPQQHTRVPQHTPQSEVYTQQPQQQYNGHQGGGYQSVQNAPVQQPQQYAHAPEHTPQSEIYKQQPQLQYGGHQAGGYQNIPVTQQGQITVDQEGVKQVEERYWVCEKCTLHNRPTQNNCETCGHAYSVEQLMTLQLPSIAKKEN